MSEIDDRVAEIKRSLGSNVDTLLLGMRIGIYGLNPKDYKPLTPAEMQKHDNRGLPEEAAHQAHLVYLKERFGLDDIEHARHFSAFIEQKLLSIYAKLAETEMSVSGEKTPDNELFDVIFRTMQMDAAKEKRTRN